MRRGDLKSYSGVENLKTPTETEQAKTVLGGGSIDQSSAAAGAHYGSEVVLRTIQPKWSWETRATKQNH